MLTLRIDQIAAQIVRHVLLGKSREERESLPVRDLSDGVVYEGDALYLHFDLRLGHYTDGESYNTSRGLHLLYYTHPGSAYVTVFAGITDSPFDKVNEVGQWKHECSHDSCWRDIQTFSQVYFKMAGEINAMLEKDGLSHIAPKDMHESNSFGVFRDELYSWVKVRVTKDPEDSHQYRKLVTIL